MKHPLNINPVEDRNKAMEVYSRLNIGDALNATEAMHDCIALIVEARDALQILNNKLAYMSSPDTRWEDGGMMAVRKTIDRLNSALEPNHQKP
jgi:hypothetical protein